MNTSVDGYTIEGELTIRIVFSETGAFTSAKIIASETPVPFVAGAGSNSYIEFNKDSLYSVEVTDKV